MENLLARFNEPDADIEKLFVQLVDLIRPSEAGDAETARRNLQALGFVLEVHPEMHAGLRRAVKQVLEVRRHCALYTTSGILPNTGFFSEAFRRIGHKFLPDVLEPDLLQTFIRKVFRRSSDRLWVAGVGETDWLHFIEALHFDEEEEYATELSHSLSEVLRALQILSYEISASGFEPEFLRLEPALEAYESPFVAQNSELMAYVEAYPDARKNPASPVNSENPGIDDKHLRVLFDQCREIIERAHKRAAQNGTSIRLTYHLQRLGQLILRCESLLDIAESLRVAPGSCSARIPVIRLFTSLISGECLRDNLYRHWRQNTELIALRVTENAGNHGEHYITENWSDYLKMARSALIGGGIIAFMAAFKILLGKTGMAPLTQALAYSLNYGIGFCMIHILHGTVATKQPAMTANAIAAEIEQTGGKLCHIENLAQLAARTFRTQMVAILGNVLLAVPLSGLIAYLFFFPGGEHFVATEKAAYLLSSQSLTQSASVLYAAIAGICLFLAGLINGFFDNYAAYNRIAERILQLEWPRRLWGAYRTQCIAAYIGENLGALSGNFLFGFLLGGTTLFGVLTGLPVDIRHVTFSSAYLGFAIASFDFALETSAVMGALFDVAVIGFFNLTVSFALAFHVAVRARQIEEVPWKQIAHALLRFLRERPLEFLFPPGKEKADGDDSGPKDG